jgi:hypothetical protein
MENPSIGSVSCDGGVSFDADDEEVRLRPGRA